MWHVSFFRKIVFCFIPAVAASFALSDAGIALGQRTPASTYAFIRSFGARINLDYSIDAESFATELVFDYKDYCKRREPSVPLEDEVSFAWVDAAVAGNRFDKVKILKLIASTPKESLDTKLTGYMALDEIDAVDEVIACFSQAEPELQHRIIVEVFARSGKYDDHASTIVAAAKRDATVTELMGQNGQQVPLMSSVDKFLLSATRRSRKAAIPQLILDKALRSAAMSLTGQLSATETAQWVETIESRELSRKPWCKVYLDFAHDDSTAEKILKICDADCRPVGDDTLRVNRERFPKVIDEYLSQLAKSKSISDNIRVIRVLGGDHFGDFPKSTVSLKAISNGLREASPDGYRDYSSWPLTFAACTRIGDRIRIRDDILGELPEHNCKILNTIAEEASEFCPKTFFCRDLREAVRLLFHSEK